MKENEIKKENKKHILLTLFTATLYLSTFTFGGGYAAIPLIESQVVTKHAWMSIHSFTNLITISQMTPGPIAINSATFIGLQVGGPLGAFLSTIGCILPSCFFVTILAYIYTKYRDMALLHGTLDSLRPAVVALIGQAGVSILLSAFFTNRTITFVRSHISIRMMVYFCTAMILLHKTKLNPIFVMFLCGVAEVIFQIIW